MDTLAASRFTTTQAGSRRPGNMIHPAVTITNGALNELCQAVITMRVAQREPASLYFASHSYEGNRVKVEGSHFFGSLVAARRSGALPDAPIRTRPWRILWLGASAAPTFL